MLANARVYPTIPASDLERARRFYEEKLGLTPSEENPGGVFYDLGHGGKLLLFSSSGSSSGSHTQAGFQVDDIDAAVTDLKSRGVAFEEYDSEHLKTVNSIAQTGAGRAAWFKDSEGNLLGVAQLK